MRGIFKNEKMGLFGCHCNELKISKELPALLYVPLSANAACPCPARPDGLI
jgi:hypothetical protein